MILDRLSALDKFRDVGLLVLRVGIGVMFLTHGGPKLAGGPEFWAKIGAATGAIGLSFAPTAFGFAAACSEFFGGLLFALGALTRPACFFLTFTMFVASVMHLTHGDGLAVASHAIELGIVFASMILIGPGALSVDAWLAKKREAK